MMNRYVPDGKGYRRISVEEQTAPAQTSAEAEKQNAQPVFQPIRSQTPAAAPAASVTATAVPAPSGSSQTLRGKIGGDLVLLLLLALVLVDGDELDLAITLALILILGL